MKTSIANDFLTATIDSCGAELVSLKTKDGVERLWHGKEHWKKHAPILFPWAGRITDGFFTHQGKHYEAPIHGFIQHEEHEILEISHGPKPFIHFCKNFDDKNVFPCSFIFEQTFSLQDTTLTHSIKVTNTDDKTLPFGQGFHPGFMCPFSADKKTEDYSIIFECPQSPERVLMENGHPTGETETYFTDQTVIQLNDEIFSNDALCFTNLTTKTYTLQEKGTSNSICMNVEGFPYVLLWSFYPQNSMRFICIEPWYTIPDFKDAPKEWTKKENLLKLESGKSFETQIAFTMNF